MWQGIGVLVGAYTLFSALRGEVYAKRGPSYEVIYRAQAPGRFWVVIAIYAGLALALFVVF